MNRLTRLADRTLTPGVGVPTAEAQEGYLSSRISRLGSILLAPSFLWVVVLVGVLVRARQYAAGSSLWLDESFLALNLIDRGMRDLLTVPLDFKQSSPAGFLFVEELAVDVFGKSEYAVRALPALSSFVALALFPLLARQVLEPAGALFAVAAFALTGPLIYYATDAKPYSGDVAATIALSIIAIRLLRRPCTVRAAFTLGLLGGLAIQLTYAGILAAAGVGAVLVAILAVDRQWERFVSVGLTVFIWAMGAVVFLVTRVGSKPSYFLHQEQGERSDDTPFAPVPSSAADLTWYFRRAAYVGEDANVYHPMQTPLVIVSIVAALLAVIGSVDLLKREWRVGAVLFVTVLVTFGASIAQQFPMIQRTILFFVPLTFLLMGRGLVVFSRHLPARVAGVAAVIVVAALLVQVSFAGVYSAVRPVRNAEMKDSLRYVAQHWREGDVLYLQYASQYAFAYYAQCNCLQLPRFGDVDSLWPVHRLTVENPSAQFSRAVAAGSPRVFIGIAPDDSQRDYRRDAELLSRRSRAWVIITFTASPRELARVQRHLIGSLDQVGRRVRKTHRSGVHLYLYDFEK